MFDNYVNGLTIEIEKKRG